MLLDCMLPVHTHGKALSCCSFCSSAGEVVSDCSFWSHVSYCQRSKNWPVVMFIFWAVCLSTVRALGVEIAKKLHLSLPNMIVFHVPKVLFRKNGAIILSLFIQKARICLVLLREIFYSCQCQQSCYDGRYVGRNSVLQWPTGTYVLC